MPQAHSIEGLIKWVERAEWQDAFNDVLDLHLLPACDQTSTDPSDVVATLGEDWFMRSVWGCGFEDFVTAVRRWPDRHRRLSQTPRLEGESVDASLHDGAADSTISLYEVSDIVLDTSFRARDLVRGEEPVLITERLATRSLKPWDRVAVRVIKLGPRKRLISGVILPFDGPAANGLLKALRRDGKRKRSNTRERGDIPASGSMADATKTDHLRAAAPMITTIWLVDVLARATKQRFPEMRNTEGDEILFCKLHFAFATRVTASDVVPC